MHMEKPLPPYVQNNTSSVYSFNIFGSSTWVHILEYCLYDPSNHKVIDVEYASFDKVPIHGLSISFPMGFNGFFLFMTLVHYGSTTLVTPFLGTTYANLCYL